MDVSTDAFFYPILSVKVLGRLHEDPIY
jgi:hypothetical protein